MAKKGNPYHDRRGRFTHGGGQGGKTPVKAANQPASILGFEAAPHLQMPLKELQTYDDPNMDLNDPYHADKMTKLRASNSDVGRPISIATDGKLAVIMDGSHRLQLAKERGQTTVPVRFHKAAFDLNDDDRSSPIGPAAQAWLKNNKPDL